MSMHLAHPALTTTGKKKGKKKWASAEHKRRSELAREQQEALYREYNVKTTKTNKKGFMSTSYKPLYNAPRQDATREIKSVESTWAPCARPPERKYTGTLIKGIATMHKSNAVPVINEEEMISISRMRRG